MTALVRWHDRPRAWMMNADGVGEHMVHAYWIALGLPTFTIGGTAYLGTITTVSYPRNR